MTDVRTLLNVVYETLDAADLCFGHGTDNAWDDSVQLVLATLGLPDDDASLNVAVSDAEQAAVMTLAGRRVTERIPVPYLTGVAWFHGLRFAVEPGVIIPRSPIGELVLRELRPWRREQPANILDLCCGTGCLGILAAHVFDSARVVCSDLDPTAVALARRNAADLGVADRVDVACSDLFDDIPRQAFDVIVCNPPYVDAADLRDMPAEYHHEPRLALAGGADGLDLVDRILRAAPAFLAERGILVCEVGNSAPAMATRFPLLHPVWPDLKSGGHGVFVLDAKQLSSHTARQFQGG